MNHPDPLTRQCDAEEPDRVDSAFAVRRYVDGGICLLGPKLTGPQGVAVVVKLAEISVILARPGLPREGSRRGAHHVNVPVAIRGDAGDVVGALGAELARPDLVAVRVVFSQVGVLVAYLGLALQGDACNTRHVDTAVVVHGDVLGFVAKLGSKLQGPDLVPIAVVATQENVLMAQIGMAGQSAPGLPMTYRNPFSETAALQA